MGSARAKGHVPNLKAEIVVVWLGWGREGKRLHLHLYQAASMGGGGRARVFRRRQLEM